MKDKIEDYNLHREDRDKLFDKITEVLLDCNAEKALNRLYFKNYDTLEELFSEYIESHKKELQELFDKKIREKLEVIANEVIENEIANFINVKGLIKSVLNNKQEYKGDMIT
jgi:hypothetical protein